MAVVVEPVGSVVPDFGEEVPVEVVVGSVSFADVAQVAEG